MRRHPRNIAGPVLALLAGAVVLAREPAVIAGKVVDFRGGGIPGASVRLSSGEGVLAETLSDLDGSFQFAGLPEGGYALAVDIVGFQPASSGGIHSANESAGELILRLQALPRPAAPKRARAPVAQRQEEPALEAPTFQAALVTDLPGLSQFRQDEAGGSSGTAPAAPGQENTLFISGNTLSLDGGRPGDAGFRGEIGDIARQMGFRMQEFTGDPPGPGEMGGGGGRGMPGGSGGGMAGGPGGGMGFVGMGGRGGRGGAFQQSWIEGTLSETYGNSALNARSYSLTGQSLDKPVHIQNNFSVTVGGALPFMKTQTARSGRSPGMGPARRPGWSFSYGGNRDRSARDILTTVPTDLERVGDFSQTYTRVLAFDPVTGDHGVASRLVDLYLDPHDPASRFTLLSAIDPIAAGLLSYIPRANIPCAAGAPCVNNYFRGVSLPSASDQIQASVTGLRFGSGNSLAVNYSMRRGSSLAAASFPGLDTDNSNFSQNAGITATHSLQPRLVLNWRLSLNRTCTESTNAYSYAEDVAGGLGITGISREPINWGPPTLDFTGYGGLSLAAPALNRNQTFSVSGGLNRIGRAHSVRGGGEAAWIQRNSRRDANARGSFSFTGYATALFDGEGNPVSGSGNDFADFLRGLPKTTSRSFVDRDINPYGNGVYLRSRNWSLYAMDNWRIRSNVTLNYGLRYEYAGPVYEKYDRLVSLDASPDFTSLAQVFPGETGSVSGKYFPRSLVSADRNNLAPRVGIAWRPGQRSPFVFRAGYGISYNSGGYSSIVNRLVNQSPFAITQSLASERSNPLTIQNGFPADPEVTIPNTYAIDPDYRPSYAQQWNLDVQAQISRLYALDISYSGVRGSGLDVLLAPDRGGNTGYFVYQTSGAGSIYHGMAVQFTRRFSQGWNLTGAYTFSKSIDDSGSGVAQNALNLAAERALSDQDQRHNFQTSFAYELPFGENRAFFPGASAGWQNFIAGWTFNGNFSAAGGFPMTPRYASGNGEISGAVLYNALRPDATGAPVTLPGAERSVVRFFNTAAFAIPEGAYGTAARNSIPGPGSIQLNLSVRKSIRLDENHRQLDFSCQVQNLLNHPNWGSVSTTVNSLNYGQVTGVRAMRSMTMNLRIRF